MPKSREKQTSVGIEPTTFRFANRLTEVRVANALPFELARQRRVPVSPGCHVVLGVLGSRRSRAANFPSPLEATANM